MALWVAGCLVSLLACGKAEAPPPEEDATDTSRSSAVEAGDLTIEDARAQLFGEIGAAFFVVHNSGSAAERLLRIESPGVASVETHETITDGSVMRMEARPDGFEIPAGESLVLTPGGSHAMLMGLEGIAPDAEMILLRLVFETQGTVEVSTPVLGRASSLVTAPELLGDS